ncbi:flavodoxin [Siphonobacter sp. SORGH_AS_0500]|uniref:flavodoxin n=1 Tax=Siphonobacter sp. SORGH_AS_0500 TaxID=1864824 RepID=UPI002857BBD2|nr:flavodoxin [Siphonobacter sp. SORGH_AS_0500]MDR6197119.1 flavodoxin [Siphonobacter sp. SORGH_AS_0500]
MPLHRSFTYVCWAFIVLMGSCSFFQKEVPTSEISIEETSLDSAKILIVYLSRTSNTKTLAEMIHHQVGGKLVALELQTPYPENYQATVGQVTRENETGFLPPLKTSIKNMDHYDLVFVGFPTWGMQLPPPMKSFLTSHDLSGKTIIPFNSNGGYGIGSSFQTVRELCPKSNVQEGFTTQGGIEKKGILLAIKDSRAKEVEREVIQWLQKLNLK